MDRHASGCHHCDHVCFCLILASFGSSGADDAGAAAGTIARARRLIDAKDYASAAALLEDLLLEAGARGTTEILGSQAVIRSAGPRGRGSRQREGSSRLPRQPGDLEREAAPPREPAREPKPARQTAGEARDRPR